MKIGLVRHYKVNLELPEKRFVTCEEVMEWFRAYDEAEIECGETKREEVNWRCCFTSDLPRAVRTAERIYQGELIKLEALREFPFGSSFKGKIELPFLLWVIMLRIKTFISYKKKEAFRKRIANALDEMISQAEGDFLVVSHGFAMLFLNKELIKRGFMGPKIKSPKNGVLYIFIKKDTKNK